ncbi:hypothetical protein B0A48_00454 [Cryoendolithus antarcticus]|uniref:Nuclear condensin complex subunit 3 C-terminal domain-containing protein n=1 Tax=Cryoendolithus antarcticus TaxID=1507870 RepID=A0A1V8TV62_9PEZI|nr:hypothetical protein B0A48_00454 [Cryoendolithus antarcticus]
MPGRIVRGGRASACSSGRNSSPSHDIPDEGADTTLRRAICGVFGDAQKSTAGHRKCVISLRKIQEACCYEPVNYKKGKQAEDFEQTDFNGEVVRIILRILAVKKSEAVGDRTVRFLGTYLNVASQKDNELLDQEDPEQTALPETPTSRLTTQILSTLLPLLQVKDKTIRFRATQITSHIINSLDSLDDSLFHQLRLNLLKRIHDKEAPVRLQAVYGLGRLAAEVEDDEQNDDSDSDNEVGQGVLVKLLDVLQNDPSAEVRRNLLLNLPLTKEVLPYLLERARDLDGATRRALYARLLPALGDFRHLSLTHREKLLRWGLRDRDENVRKATARLFRERWIEDCAALPAEQAEDAEAQPTTNNQAADPSLDALLELLERIDIVNSGADGGIAQLAMKEFWEGRPDYVDYVSFPDTFWDDLSPELAFVARTFNDFCRSSGREDGYAGPRALDVMVEEKLPEVTKFGYLLEHELNRLVETIRAAASGEDEDAEEDSAQREFVVEQMLYMALTFDYSDEVGRRKMFGLMREALALPELPEESTRLVVEVLRLVCGESARGEGEFCSVVLEAVAEVHDTIMGDLDEDDTSMTENSFHSATTHFDGEEGDEATHGKKSKKKNEKADSAESEISGEDKAIRSIMVNMKCLHIAQCMLQNVACDLQENIHLVTMLNNLVVPAVRSQEAPIRERGLVCLGLCCLLGKNLAEENLTLFLHCFTKGHPALQSIALQIIADILITHPSLLAIPEQPADVDATSATAAPENALIRPILKAFSRSLKSSDATVQATGANALAKTMLSQLITDTDLLKQLVVVYFDPDTAANFHLRQSLSYFLPVYCHSRAENAARLVGVACPVLAKLTTLREAFLDEVADAEEEEGGMVKLNTIGNMLLDWTDPRKIVGFAEAAGPSSGKAEGTHYLFAETILERLVTSQVSKDEKKVLFSLLGRLHLPAEGCDEESLNTILELLAEAVDTKVASDATSKNVLAKLQTQLLKMMHDVMTLQRGGGGAEETVMETTEMPDETAVLYETAMPDTPATRAGATEAEIEESFDEDAGLEDEDADVTQLRTEMRDTTLGFNGTTIGLDGLPDAEGTRVQLAEGDTELLESSVVEESIDL